MLGGPENPSYAGHGGAETNHLEPGAAMDIVRMNSWQLARTNSTSACTELMCWMHPVQRKLTPVWAGGAASVLDFVNSFP